MENCQRQHGDEDEDDGRYGKIDRLGREAGRAGVVSHGPPSPVLVNFSVQFPGAIPMAGSPPGHVEQVGKRPGAWPGPDLAEANGLLLLLARLFVGRLRAARVLGLLLRVGRIGRLRGFVGALLRI